MHVAMDGLTEAADAGATNQELRALSGQKTVPALRVYLKETAVQRMMASQQQREHVEKNRSGAKVRIGRETSSQNRGARNDQCIDFQWRSLREWNSSFQIKNLAQSELLQCVRQSIGAKPAQADSIT
jgi:hypothetical protein